MRPPDPKPDACRVSTKHKNPSLGFLEIFTLGNGRTDEGANVKSALTFVFFARFLVLTSRRFPLSRPPPVACSQEAKAEARRERLDFELNGPNKQMTKKERKKLEAQGFD